MLGKKLNKVQYLCFSMNKKKKNRLIGGGIVALVVILVLVSSQYYNFGWGTGGGVVERTFEKEIVAPGETIKVQLHIKLDKDQSYYFIEEIVPEGFVVLDDVARENKIRLAKIQNAESTTFSYMVEASQEKGIYTFSGEYGIEFVNGTRNIEGTNRISVE